MNFNLIKRSFAATLLLSIISSTGSAFAYTPKSKWNPNPVEPKTCVCPQPPSWETRIKEPIYCPLRYCPDFRSSSLQTILQVGSISEPITDRTYSLIAGANPGRNEDGGGWFVPAANPIGSQPAPGESTEAFLKRTGRPDGSDGLGKPTGTGGSTAEQRERNRESGHKGHGGPL